MVALEDITVVTVVMLARGDVVAMLARNSGVVSLIIVVEDEAVVMDAIMNPGKRNDCGPAKDGGGGCPEQNCGDIIIIPNNKSNNNDNYYHYSQHKNQRYYIHLLFLPKRLLLLFLLS